jgi:DNA uptake protein ComE-like DNA-binding protein
MKTRAGMRRQGSVLIIALWVAFGLVSVALYFAQSMAFELRASDNRVAAMEAAQAINGAARYVSYSLSTLEEPGTMPDLRPYHFEAAPIGQAQWWFLGREDEPSSATVPFFGLQDESAKLNLNTATSDMLERLPRMTPELAAAIVDWRDTDSEVTQGGAETDIYSRLRPPYRCKNGPFETVEELRLVAGAELEILYGEDTNLNGILDRNEDDGNVTPPDDDRDGQIDPGILEYLTVYSRDSNNLTNVNTPQQLAPLLEAQFGEERAGEILQRVGGGGGGGNIRSLLQFYQRSSMSPEEFAQVEGFLTVTNGGSTAGLVNVNTASEIVLACIPGIGEEKAAALVAERRSRAGELNSLAWVTDVLEENDALEAGPYLTGRSHQYTADIAAVGRHGRGYRRTRFVFDVSQGNPGIRFRQDLAHLGWALGPVVRQNILFMSESQ